MVKFLDTINLNKTPFFRTPSFITEVLYFFHIYYQNKKDIRRNGDVDRSCDGTDTWVERVRGPPVKDMLQRL